MLSRKNISGEKIIFTDETRIDIGSYIHDSLRLSKETNQKLKEGQKDAFELINRLVS